MSGEKGDEWYTDEVQQHEESDALLQLTCDVSTDDEADSESDAESEEERPPTHTQQRKCERRTMTKMRWDQDSWLAAMRNRGDG